jgi:signal transduction histidine kinase
MPQIDGVALLEKAARSHPDIVRMVISGWADADTVLDAVNNGHIYRYIVKPWDRRELKVTLRQALKMYHLQAERREMLSQLRAHNIHLEKTVAQRSQQIMAFSRQADIGKYTFQLVEKLNEPLDKLSSAIELIGLMTSKDDLDPNRIRKEVGTAQTGIDQLKQIVTGIRGRTQDDTVAQLGLVNLNQLIKEELDYFDLDPFFRREVEKELYLMKNIPGIMGNTTQMKQILHNLIKNAIEAMALSDEKKLTIKTILQGNVIAVEISDTGTGISQENQERIFSDNFTTKPIGEGTGLGLSSIKSMVAAYSGYINFFSTPQKGTTFKLNFPTGRSTVR